MGALCTDAYTSGTTGARTATSTRPEIAACSPVSGSRRRILVARPGARLTEVVIAMGPGGCPAGGSLVECLTELGGERLLVACHLRGERCHVHVLRADGRIQRLERVLAAVARRERVAARLEPGVAQRLLAGVAEHEVKEQLGRVGAGRAGGDPDAARDQRREVPGVLPAQELALGGAGLDGAAGEPGFEDGHPVSALGDVRPEHVAVPGRLRGLAELGERGPALLVHVAPEGAVAEVVVDRVGSDLVLLVDPVLGDLRDR